jgi:two-component system chemotaxis sensor kinase CheA
MMDAADTDLIRAFWQQAELRIGEMTDLWLSIEDGSADAKAAAKRLLHTMKGEAHMLGIRECAHLIQAMEEVVIKAQPSDAGDAILTALDAIAVMATNGGGTAEGLLEIIARLEEIADTAEPNAQETAVALKRPSSVPPPEPELEMPRLDPLVLSPLVHEARRVHREQALLVPKLREVRRMLRALLAEMDPSHTESLHERIVKTLGYGAELERRMADLGTEWSTSEFALDMALERLDETVRSASMVSVGALKAQVHRATRAAASALDKRVKVSISGDAYVDATVERSLGPALLHLVRNAVDHGIEMPDERERSGKSAEGSIDIAIQQSDSSVNVTVSDDGAGVDLDAVRRKLARSGKHDPNEDDEQLLQHIFDHGISTRDTATELSGRGVGLDVVARQVASVGGSVRVESVRGKGTKFELVLPTMLRADVVVPVEVQGVRLALAARTIVSVERITDIVQASDGPRLPRGKSGAAELVPLFDLGAVFDAGVEPEIGEPAAVIRHRTGTYAVRVDRYDNPRALSFERIEELPIRSDIVRGVAAAPDGGVFFLLDADTLYDTLRARRSGGSVSRSKAARQTRVLVVEDAPVARELLLGLLRSFGLSVSDAADGREGLRAAREDPPDLIISDIEMPFLGGLEMIAEIRRDPALAAVPVVVLTTRTDAAVKDRARVLGVRYFLSKQRFVESELKKVVELCLAG